MKNKYSKDTEFGQVRHNKYRENNYNTGNRNQKRYTGKNSNQNTGNNYAPQQHRHKGNNTSTNPGKYYKNGYYRKRNNTGRKRPFLRMPKENSFLFLKAKPKKTDSRKNLKNLIDVVTGNFQMPLLMPYSTLANTTTDNAVFSAIIKDNKILSEPDNVRSIQQEKNTSADNDKISGQQKTKFVPLKFGKRNYSRNKIFSFSISNNQHEELLIEALDYYRGRLAFIKSHPAPQKKISGFRNFFSASFGNSGKYGLTLKTGRKYAANLLLPKAEISVLPHQISDNTTVADRPYIDWLTALTKENESGKILPRATLATGKNKNLADTSRTKKKQNKYALEAVNAKEEVIELPPEDFIKMTFPSGSPNDKNKQQSKRQTLRTIVLPEAISDFSQPGLSPAKIILDRVAYLLQNEFSIIEGSRVMLGVSGGADSMTMLHIFAQLTRRFNNALYVAHFNHKLRGQDSDDDEQLVKNVCASYGIKCYTDSADIAKAARDMSISTEEAARYYRYKMYERLAGNLQLDFVATAHNLDDSVETFFLNLMRGTGLKGLSGIPRTRHLIKNTFMIRPMLDFRKSEIYNYAKLLNLQWHEDRTNQDTDFTRNRIRMKLLPMLSEEFSPAIFELIKRTENLISGADSFINSYINNALPNIIKERRKDGFTYYPAQLDTFPAYIRSELVRRAISEVFKIIPPNSNMMNRIINLKNSQSGAVININKTIFAAKDRDCITFGLQANVENFLLKINTTGTFQLDNGKLLISDVNRKSVKFTTDPLIEFFDKDLLPEEMTIRTWKPGDEFVPIGMQGNMKVSNFLTNLKVPNIDKRSVKVMLANNKIVWVIGYRIGNLYKVTEETVNAVKAEFILTEAPKDEENACTEETPETEKKATTDNKEKDNSRKNVAQTEQRRQNSQEKQKSSTNRNTKK